VIDFAYRQPLLVKGQERAPIRQLTAGAAADTVTFAVFVNRQDAGGRPLKLSGPGIFREKLCFNTSHNNAR